MIRLLEINPNTNDAMSFYRGRLPLLRLQKKYPDKFMLFPGGDGNNLNLNWDNLVQFDLVYIIRPSSDRHVTIIKTCNFYNIPVWVDYDDLLTEVPMYNPAHPGYSNPAIQKNMQTCMKLATFVTWSTRHLMKKMGKDVLGKSTVIENAMDPEIFNNFHPVGNNRRVVWRGSATHEEDLYIFADAIRVPLRKRKDIWELELMGMNPIFLSYHVDLTIYTPYMDKTSYFEYLSKVDGQIMIVPLKDSDFNKAKSNIAWIEGTYSGLCVLAPDWDEWRKPGVINYKSLSDFKEKLTAMIDGKYDLKAHNLESWQYIKDNLTLDSKNEIRWQLISKHSGKC